MIDLVSIKMEPYLREKRVPPQSLLFRITDLESDIFKTKNISLDRKIGYYELLRKAFDFESRCVTKF